LRVAAEGVPGIKLYLQPVQELTIEDRVSRTQYQFNLTCPDESLLDEWVPQVVARLQALPELPTSRATCRTTGCRRLSRSTAMRRAGSG
jgi:multidrug efflux pump